MTVKICLNDQLGAGEVVEADRELLAFESGNLHGEFELCGQTRPGFPSPRNRGAVTVALAGDRRGKRRAGDNKAQIASCDQCANEREIPARSRTEALGRHDVTPYPHGIARAARGHARLGYAGGSWWVCQFARVGGLERDRRFNRELVSHSRDKPANIQTGQHADCHRRTTRAAKSFDMLGEPFVVVDGMPMNCAIGMRMRKHLTMPSDRLARVEMAVGMLEMTSCFAGRCFRGCDQSPLQRERHHGRHHDDDSEPSQKWQDAEAQIKSSFV
jgi:hypothetical protein